jgi:ribosomal protein S18 acetylase RimI-like enzyme
MGRREEADQIAQLILSTEPILLSYLFGGEQQTAAFLKFACKQDDGQFSAYRHYVLNQENNKPSDIITGVYTLWHSDMPSTFESFTLSALKSYFNVQQLGHLIINKTALDDCFLAPQPHQLCIGHIAVLENYRHKGIASQFLEMAKQKAVQMGKQELVLDVEKRNEAAVNCYLKAGFSANKQSQFLATEQVFLRMALPI